MWNLDNKPNYQFTASADGASDQRQAEEKRFPPHSSPLQTTALAFDLIKPSKVRPTGESRLRRARRLSAAPAGRGRNSGIPERHRRMKRSTSAARNAPFSTSAVEQESCSPAQRNTNAPSDPRSPAGTPLGCSSAPLRDAPPGASRPPGPELLRLKRLVRGWCHSQQQREGRRR